MPEIISGVREACAALRRLGFKLIMVTNQPDVALGRTSKEFVDAVNEDLARDLRLDGIEVCFHDDQADCECRKPKPGMLLHAAAKYRIDLSASIIVGDRWRDIEAGRRAGCRTVFVDYGYQAELVTNPDHVANSLRSALEWIRNLSIMARNE